MDINKIKDRIKTLKAKNNESKILFIHSSKENYKKDDILSIILNSKRFIYIEDPDGSIYMGIDAVMDYTFNSSDDLINFSDNNFEVHNNTQDEINLFGGLSFDMEHPNTFPWEDIHKGYFFLPKITFKFIQDTVTITYATIINQNDKYEQHILSEIKKYSLMFKKTLLIKEKKTTITERKLHTNKQEYISQIKFIKSKNVDKVVLSRIEEYQIEDKINFHSILNYLNNNFPSCYNFLIKFKKDNYFIGSSPEQLLYKKNKEIHTVALAGTSKNISSLKNKKETEEHSYVIEYIKNILKGYTQEIQIKKTKTFDLKYAHHIYTKINATLVKDIHILDILEKLYPTPALCGVPKSKAREILTSIENFNRGWYGGVIGMYNLKGNGNFHVPIRSALIKNDKIYFHVGAGILKESNPDLEWEETKLKLKHLKGGFILK